MENMIDFPWYRNHGGLQFDYNEQFVVQKELFLENFLRLTAQILDVTNIIPGTLIRVVDQEKPGTTLSCYSGWLLTKNPTTLPRVRKYGSNEPVTTFESYSGLALTPENKLLEYGALDENLKKGEVIHFSGKHLVDEIPDKYIQSSADVSSELIYGLAKICPIQSSIYDTFVGLSSVK